MTASQYPLVAFYDENGRPIKLAEATSIVVSSISATNYQGLPAAGGAVAVSSVDIGQIYFNLNDSVASGIPLPSPSGYLFASATIDGVVYSWEEPEGTGGTPATTLDELTDVSVPSPLTFGHVLTYSNDGGVPSWRSKPPPDLTPYVPINAAGTNQIYYNNGSTSVGTPTPTNGTFLKFESNAFSWATLYPTGVAFQSPDAASVWFFSSVSGIATSAVSSVGVTKSVFTGPRQVPYSTAANSNPSVTTEGGLDEVLAVTNVAGNTIDFVSLHSLLPFSTLSSTVDAINAEVDQIQSNYLATSDSASALADIDYQGKTSEQLNGLVLKWSSSVDSWIPQKDDSKLFGQYITGDYAHNILILSGNLEDIQVSDWDISSLDLHLGDLGEIAGTEIHHYLSSLDERYLNASGDTMNGVLNASALSGVNYIEFDLTPTVDREEGRLYWNDDYKTLELDSANQTSMYLGQEVSIRVINNTGATLNKGQVVYVSGVNSNVAAVALASASAEATTHRGLGVLKQSLTTGNRGLMILFGYLSGIDTSIYQSGETLYLGLTPGSVTNVYASAFSHPELIGSVVNVGTSGSGSILVHIQHGYETTELHNVSRTPASATGQILVWNEPGNYYEPKFHNDIGGLTEGNPHTQYATLSGASFSGPVNIYGSSATSNPLLNLSTTWNTASGPTAFRLNVIDTSSATSALLMDLQNSGISRFKVFKNGDVQLGTGFGALYFNGTAYNLYQQSNYFQLRTGGSAFFSQAANEQGYTGNSFYINNNSAWFALGSSYDVKLNRDAAGILAQRDGSIAQTSRIYNTYTNASNYERAALGWDSSSFVIKTEALGTGANRSLMVSSAAALQLRSNATGGSPVDINSRLYVTNTLAYLQSGITKLNLNNSVALGWAPTGDASTNTDSQITRVSSGILQVSSSLIATSALVAPLVSSTTVSAVSAIANTVSATTYLNLPVNQKIIAVTIPNPSSVTYYPLFYAKYIGNIEEVNSVIVDGSSITWSMWLASDVSDPTTGTQLYDSKITDSTTTGNVESSASLSEGWVVLEIVGYSGAVKQLQITLITD